VTAPPPVVTAAPPPPAPAPTQRPAPPVTQQTVPMQVFTPAAPPQAPTASPDPTATAHVAPFAWWHSLDAVMEAPGFVREPRNVALSMEATPGEDAYRYVS
jgi:hypothetical protein